ncbi:hypothetical protein HanRHA438_Chr05g0236891 [Helianthus annuus]|nr:hypothetical protein HanRHA438_Chr05g0236891 [Helianthus annuus]
MIAAQIILASFPGFFLCDGAWKIIQQARKSSDWQVFIASRFLPPAVLHLHLIMCGIWFVNWIGKGFGFE